jgi:hypothetical protein
MREVNRPVGFGVSMALVVAQVAPLPALAPIGLAVAAAQSGGQYNTRPQTIPCYSRNGGTNTCRLPDRTVSVSFMGPDRSGRCREGQTWRRVGNSIQVQQGCGGNFEALVRNGGSGGNWGGSNRGFAGQLECRSKDNRYRRCGANTDKRVELLRQFSSSNCVRGRSWGFDRGSIWVDQGCQARFGYGYGNVRGDTSGDDGRSDAGAVIGGVALAAGLVALLAAAGKSSSSSRSAASSTATLTADLNQFPSDARAPAQACLNEAARQVGATGGTAVKLDRVDGASRSGEGWMILARLTATHQNQSHPMAMDCRYMGDKVTAFDVR